MPLQDTERPWDELEELVLAEDSVAAREFLQRLEPDDRRLTLSRLSIANQTRLVEILPPEAGAELLEEAPEALAIEILELMRPEAAADVVEELSDDVSADLLREMHQEETEAVLAELDDADEADHLRERTGYPWDTAGGLMTERFAAFEESASVGDVLRELSENAEQYSDMDVQYVYVVGNLGELKGVLRLRDLVLTSRTKRAADIMITDPISVSVTDDFEALVRRFDEKKYIGLPVVDPSGRLLGVITQQAVREATADHQTDDYLAASGIVGGEELRSMPMLLRCRRRLAWLAPNIALNLVAASIIAVYEDTIQQVIALAVFLPIVSDMSGCSGNQAVAVSMRELTLGLIRPGEYLRVVWKEGILGMVNGCVLGLLLGMVAFFWKDNIWLGLVVGCALAFNTVVSVLLGGLVPLLMKRFKIDPALASGPILTTCTDMCGFFLVLNLASMALAKLT